MKKSVKELWVKALRSGKYEQSKYVLNDGKGFCCLGVLCEVYQKEAKKNHKKRLVVEKGVDDNAGGLCIAYDGAHTKLPDRVVKWAGLDLDDPTILSREDDYGDIEDIFASEANDVRGWNFKQIADAIEENL